MPIVFFFPLWLTVDEGIWKCTGSSGATFPEVDLSEGEWTDYDEKASRKGSL